MDLGGWGAGSAGPKNTRGVVLGELFDCLVPRLLEVEKDHVGNRTRAELMGKPNP